MTEEINAIDMILDENNVDNVFLMDEDDNEVEFEQIALVPLNSKIYAILKPVEVPEGMDDDQAYVFFIDIDEDDMAAIFYEEDDATIDAVFDEYYKMCDEEEE